MKFIFKMNDCRVANVGEEVEIIRSFKTPDGDVIQEKNKLGTAITIHQHGHPVMGFCDVSSEFAGVAKGMKAKIIVEIEG